MAEPSSDSASPSPLDDFLCFLVYSTGFAFNRVYRRSLEQMGLTYPQYLVMLVLWADDGLAVGQIGDRMKLDSGTLTPLLKRLENLALISRARSAEDERRVIVTLTDNGRALRSRATEVMNCLTAAVGMDQDKLAGLMQDMRALRDSLEEAAG